MRNYDIIPLQQETMYEIDCNPSMRFISSNGYYGFHYQPQNLKCENSVNAPMNVEEQYNYSNNNSTEKMEINLPRFVNRKRTWQEVERNELPVFKKRRENETKVTNQPRQYCKNTDADSTRLLEEMLRETHGSTFYHWKSVDL